ncbi:MAG: hypothetical protein JWO94_110 [Verrucomicrobiaceae bacterium]|nr:hypothetical protein [Verrucomicrobiaceae bacterium]
MNLTRRQVLAQLVAAGLIPAQDAEKLPPVRQITKGPGFHWFGYYDKFQFSPDGRFVLGNHVTFEHRSPTAEDTIKVGMVDLQDGDKWIELGETHAWNWQQGCMLQWVPGTAGTVMWNDRVDGQLVCHLLEVQTGKKRTLPHPVYNVSPDGRWGLAPDFRRLNDCRPGYGYAGLPDPNANTLVPEDAGIWKIDMETGKQDLLITFADAAAIPYEGGFSKGAKHWFNHLLFSPNGERFIFLHRWRGATEGKGFSTRLFTASKDGKDLYDLDPLGKTSHFVWRDPQHVFAWAYHPSHGERFYLYGDKTRDVEVVGPDKMPVNGHNTYLPGTGNQWVLNDCYPDKQRLQNPYLYHIPDDRRVPLGHFYSPALYTGEWRCDNHPRSSRDGKWVCIDSPHNHGRQMYLIDLAGLT